MVRDKPRWTRPDPSRTTRPEAGPDRLGYVGGDVDTVLPRKGDVGPHDGVTLLDTRRPTGRPDGLGGPVDVPVTSRSNEVEATPVSGEGPVDVDGGPDTVGR